MAVRSGTVGSMTSPSTKGGAMSSATNLPENPQDDVAMAEASGASAVGPEPGGHNGPGSAGSWRPSAAARLESLAPRYEEPQHRTYLNRLEEAVKDPKNLNIALTGRYGAGKSSVLDKFEENHKSTTLRLAISTLGPDSADATLTNRIQKELVKQLIFSAKPSTLRHSRFSRIIPLPTWRAVAEAAVTVAVVGALLALLGWLPPVVGTGDGHPVWLRVASWALFAGLVVAILATVRLVTYNRFVISDLSAGGASVTLSERTFTYFDEYLEEIVHFFDTESPDIVIFEDLDRFNDPHIFEALREFNTSLNKTPARVAKGVPLRFVYAVRDSLFEKLGADTEAEGDDAASAETVRANRTKFFDVVIPLVPFISHRNARELLTELLDEAGITGIDRRLVNLVAQHATDMRLLRNMRNEYLVFAERLLESDKVAPGLTPSNLFALVAYKNFHLEDFEQIARRGSDLDRLYRYHRDLVRQSVQALEQRKRNLLAGRSRECSMTPLARTLGERLRMVSEYAKSRSGYPSYPLVYYTIGDTSFASAKSSTYDFWVALAHAGAVQVMASQNPASGGVQVLTLDADQVRMLVPEAFDAARWERIDDDALRSGLTQIDADIEFLRGADFADLAADDQFTLSVPEPVTTPAGTPGADAAQAAQATPEAPQEVEHVDRTFAELAEATMRSDLARDLVMHRYLDRNFALYAAQFYGNFTGVDVATFLVQSVQSNTMDIDYRFTSDEAVPNLLEEADEDFFHTVAAYNITVLDHLLRTGDTRAAAVVDHMVTHFDSDARTFLTAYLGSGKQRPLLAAHLATRPWRAVFGYLVDDDDVPADVRPDLVDSALLAAKSADSYDVDAEVGAFILDHYRGMTAFTEPQSEAVTLNVIDMLVRAVVRIPDLEVLHVGLRALVVEQNLYLLTAPNLRAALDITGEVPLDRVRENSRVYQCCLNHPHEYLTAVEADEGTPHTVRSAETLTAVLSDITGDSAGREAEEWDESQIRQLVAGAARDSALPQLSGVPAALWPVLAEMRLFSPSLANVEAYRSEFGEIDEHLAALLLHAGAIDTDTHTDAADASTGAGGEEVDKQAAAVALLGARTIRSPADRVNLVRSLVLDEPLPVSDLRPEPSDLLALLIQHELVTDDAAAFSHFHEAGWAAIGPAIIASTNINTFVAPKLVDGMVADLFANSQTRDKLGRQMVEAFDEYVPDDDGRALTAAAQYAASQAITLSPGTVRRVANTGSANRDLVLRLLKAASPAPTAQDIVDVFASLGHPYNGVALTGAKFEVPHDELHRALLQKLTDANLCSYSKKRSKPRFVVKVPAGGG